MKQIFLGVMVCALLFDLWFSDGVPWAVIIVIALAIVYKVVKPFLRI